MSLFSFPVNNQEEISIVFHIGSGSLEGYIIKFSKISKPEILYSTKLTILFQKNLNPERYFDLMINALDATAKDIEKRGLHHLNFTGLKKHGIKKVHYMLSSPWCVSQTKVIKINKGSPFEVSRESIVDVLGEQENKFLSDSSVEGRVIIEKKIIEAKLNGYKTNEIYGKKPSIVEISLFLTSSSESVLKKIKDTVGKYFNFDSSNFHSFALSSFFAIRDIYPDKESFIYVDIHEELTDLSIIKEDVFIESVSFPVGRNFFIRKLAEKFRISADESISSISLHFDGKLDKKASDKFINVANETSKHWSENFHSAVATLSLRMNFPRTIFIAVDDDLGAFLVNKLKDERFSRFGMTEELFDVIIVSKKKLEEKCEFGADSKKGTIVEMECLFLNKLFNLK